LLEVFDLAHGGTLHDQRRHARVSGPERSAKASAWSSPPR